MNVLVTGATGFVGAALVEKMVRDGHQVRAVVRSEPRGDRLPVVAEKVVFSLSDVNDHADALRDIKTVVHLAARVHIMNDAATDPLHEFRKVNTEGTLRLAREAVKAGVKRMVFVSTVKVNGEESVLPYTEDSSTQPSDPYGVSKWEAEQGLRKIESETGLEVVIVRPTLVYGPRVRANFMNMLKLVAKGFPLPLASIANKRSLIYIGNLVDALATCALHPAAAGKTFLVSDGEDVSTPELIKRTAHALQVKTRLFPVPVSVMRVAGKLTGKSAVVDRLVSSLVVDSSKIRRELGWRPPFTMEQGLARTADWFRNRAIG